LTGPFQKFIHLVTDHTPVQINGNIDDISNGINKIYSGKVEKYIVNMELPKELGWKSQKGQP